MASIRPNDRTAGVPPAIPTLPGVDSVEWRSRGYIPHLHAASLVQHVVFRLADSLPLAIRENIARMPLVDRVGAADAALDQGHGRRELANPEVAQLTQTALLRFDGERYALLAWCVMPTHVHALLEPKSGHKLGQIVHSWKSYTAKEANRLLARRGSFWAADYFDRFMRDEDHLTRTAAYIEANPVKAGLCAGITDWRSSSAWHEWGGRDARGPDAGYGGRDAGAPDRRR
jgi:REP element-mobilizing transposase RayT